jgi:chromosomal replication initiation ATPase DnaA
MVKDVVEVTSKVFDVPARDLFGPWRNRKIVHARHAASWLARKHTAKSYPQIGAILNRDHSTIMNGVRQVEERWMKDPLFRSAINHADAHLKALSKRKTTPAKMEILTNGR